MPHYTDSESCHGFVLKMFLSCTLSSLYLLPPSRPWPILHDSFCLPKMLGAWEVAELVKALSPKHDAFSIYVKPTHLWSQCGGMGTEMGKISGTHRVQWDKLFKKEEGRGESWKILDIDFLSLHAYTCTLYEHPHVQHICMHIHTRAYKHTHNALWIL